jgi:type IV pilus assembly protein PilV
MKTMCQAKGFSLMEVLIAIVIVATGVLGIAGLQIVSMQNNTSALFRTQANQLAYDIIDRARANPNADYNIAIGDDAPAAPDCLNVDCDTAQMANFDLNVWLTDVTNMLPNGDASVVVAGNLFTVTVQWDDSRDGNATPVSIAVTTAF